MTAHDLSFQIQSTSPTFKNPIFICLDPPLFIALKLFVLIFRYTSSLAFYFSIELGTDRTNVGDLVVAVFILFSSLLSSYLWRQKMSDQFSIQESRKRARENVDQDKQVVMAIVDFFMTIVVAWFDLRYRVKEIIWNQQERTDRRTVWMAVDE
ncbi:uncharacterized protein LOC130827713 [Amaranthus tricolor]|uniref:uncharacterized protein LOC130827713 n=1 Tax=Amaranthus tricolor TaxID=29722 RepID=UPI002582F742|nr:uncharacterized protein LOC130827713 [Amaranthus tricolor]